MKTAVIIPARYASTRYPGKPLALIRQPDGSRKTLIRMTWESANEVSGIDDIYIATDDNRIREECVNFGANVIMTSSECSNGTTRCAETLRFLKNEPDIVVNFQGDAPLTPSWFVEALVDSLRANEEIGVATPVLRCDLKTYRRLSQDRKTGLVGGTTVVFDENMNALYFSKEVVPYLDPGNLPVPLPVFHHVGVYAYRPTALRQYIKTKTSSLEIQEGLEQLRFLHVGVKVKCVEVNAKGHQFWELNNPSDVERIEAALEQS